MPTLLDVGAGRVVVVSTFYKVSELLGMGRYSEVYKAFDTNSQTDVAVKLYSPESTRKYPFRVRARGVPAPPGHSRAGNSSR